MRFVNGVLLFVMLVLFVTGVVMLYGTWLPWLFDLHRIAGWAFIALIPWKVPIVYGSLKRRFGSWNVGVAVSLTLTPLVLLVALLGLLWMWRVGPYITLLGQTFLSWHWILGLLLLPLFVAHVVIRWPAPRAADFTSRRGALRLLALSAVGIAGWWLGEQLAQARATEERPRRALTGSRRFGAFTGNDFPVTGEGRPQIDLDEWRLVISGGREPLALTHEELLALPREEIEQRLDCTNGWYTLQRWQGVPLARLIEEVADPSQVAGVRITSATGFNHTFTAREVESILFATHVGGEALSVWHGAPLRAIVPERRGWFWVKWITHVELLDNRLEVLAGILAAPREVLRQM